MSHTQTLQILNIMVPILAKSYDLNLQNVCNDRFLLKYIVGPSIIIHVFSLMNKQSKWRGGQNSKNNGLPS